MPRQVDYYFSLSSPWAYIGHKVFRDLVQSHGLTVNHKPVILVDLFSETGGLPLVKRIRCGSAIGWWNCSAGATSVVSTSICSRNIRRSMRGSPTARCSIEAGFDPDPLLRRAFAAVWERELNLADAATIASLADEVGLPGARLVERSASEAISAVYEQNRQDAIAADVFGSPVYVLDGEVFWGQDRLELLADALKSGRKAYSSNPAA